MDSDGGLCIYVPLTCSYPIPGANVDLGSCRAPLGVSLNLKQMAETRPNSKYILKSGVCQLDHDGVICDTVPSYIFLYKDI